MRAASLIFQALARRKAPGGKLHYRNCWWTERAGRSHHETTMTLKWIAERLNPGAAGSLANLLRDTEWKR
jgi:hypothetical protein